MHQNRSTERFPQQRGTSTSVNEGKDAVSRRNLFQMKRNLQTVSIPTELTNVRMFDKPSDPVAVNYS